MENLLSFCQSGFDMNVFDFAQFSCQCTDFVGCSVYDQGNDGDLPFFVRDAHSAYDDGRMFVKDAVDFFSLFRIFHDDAHDPYAIFHIGSSFSGLQSEIRELKKPSVKRKARFSAQLI